MFVFVREHVCVCTVRRLGRDGFRNPPISLSSGSGELGALAVETHRRASSHPVVSVPGAVPGRRACAALE